MVTAYQGVQMASGKQAERPQKEFNLKRQCSFAPRRAINVHGVKRVIWNLLASSPVISHCYDLHYGDHMFGRKVLNETFSAVNRLHMGTLFLLQCGDNE